MGRKEGSRIVTKSFQRGSLFGDCRMPFYFHDDEIAGGKEERIICLLAVLFVTTRRDGMGK